MVFNYLSKKKLVCSLTLFYSFKNLNGTIQKKSSTPHPHENHPPRLYRIGLFCVLKKYSPTLNAYNKCQK